MHTCTLTFTPTSTSTPTFTPTSISTLTFTPTSTSTPTSTPPPDVASGGGSDWALGAAAVPYSYSMELRDTGR